MIHRRRVASFSRGRTPVNVRIMRNVFAIGCVAVLACSGAAAAERAARDLQGIWTGGTLTPLERPANHADKPLLTQAEMAAEQRQLTEKFWAAGHRMGEVGRDNDAFLDDELTVLSTGQTALIVDPPDGHLPLRPEVEARRQANLTRFDSYETSGIAASAGVRPSCSRSTTTMPIRSSRRTRTS